MLKSNLGNYSIIVDGTWGEISFNGEVVQYGNIEDQKIDTQKILLNHIVKDAIKLRDDVKEGKESINNWLSQFDNEEVKIFRTAYAKKSDSETICFLAEQGYTIESYINSLQ